MLLHSVPTFGCPTHLLVLSSVSLSCVQSPIVTFLTTRQILDLQGNLLNALPSSLGKLSLLEKLELGQNCLTQLPSSLSKLTSLTFVDLMDNKLTEFPECLVKLTALTELDVSANAFVGFPTSLTKLTSLQKLGVSSLRIQKFPSAITTLVSLTSLMIERNYIPSISKRILKLAKLEKLDISYNDLEEIPDFLSGFTSLKLLCIEGNKAEFKQDSVKVPGGCRVRVEAPTPDMILPGLWLGSLESARNRHFLLRRGITHVLSIIECEASFFPELFTYKHISARDHDSEDLSAIFEEAIAFIDEGRQKGGVVVHCAMGVSRSASLVIAYVMKSKKMCFADAYHFVKKHREVIYPNEGFKKQLLDFEDSIKTGKKENCIIS